MLKFKCQNSKFKINPNVKCQIAKLKFCHLEFSICHYFVICALSFVILMMGCATIKEAAKCVKGVSTKVLEDGRKDAIKMTLGCQYSECYSKVLEKLKQIGTYIYAEDRKKQMIAVYLHKAAEPETATSETEFTITDTTPVGIFFKEIDAKNTQIEVSSPSTYAKEFISAKIFSALEPEPKEEESYEKK
jgi:hypothetical protein